ncbi:unnamed protein product, partial [marine sediment metagenome]
MINLKIQNLKPTVDDIYTEVVEIEHHLHNYERWFGKSADQSGNDWAIESGLTAFQAESAAGDFGTAIKILGPADTPDQTGMTKFDLHRVMV